MDEQQKTDFQVGDTVWCVVYGKGAVVRINPVKVRFFNRSFDITYTADGRFDSKLPRSLFFSEPKIDAQTTRPFVPTLVDEWLLIITNNGQCYKGRVEEETKTTIRLGTGAFIYKSAISRLAKIDDIPKYIHKD